MAEDSWDDICDVLVVGYGPVGQTLTILLARSSGQSSVLSNTPTKQSTPAK